MAITINKETIKKLDVPGPRYTSYPTVPVWSADISQDQYIQTLKSFSSNQKTLSLYIHIPFCQSMCRFCACSVIIRKPDEKYADEYLHYLFKEIELVSENLNEKPLVKQLHLGGGTPTFLTQNQMERLYKKILQHFDIDLDAEIAIEVDPRTINDDKLKHLRDLGFNRLSMGIQDFNEKVQEAVNRIQSFEMVQNCFKTARRLAFSSVNCDLIYGLPYQTQKSFSETVQKVVDLRPDRIALYSFAYVPWLKKHQTHFDEKTLPKADEKLDIFLTARDLFINSGYQAIAMDHFATKEDELAKSYNNNTLYRNFMGYTLKPADEYIGLGISSIGFIGNMYVQNNKILKDYYENLKAGRLPLERGKVLNKDDQIRQYTINSLMCRFKLDKKEFLSKFNVVFDEYFYNEQKHIQMCVNEQLITLEDSQLIVTELGKLFIRNVCMGFDFYLKEKQNPNQFSRTV